MSRIGPDTDPIADRLTRDLPRLAARIDPEPPPPLELVERRSLTPTPAGTRPRRGRSMVGLAAAAAVVVGVVVAGVGHFTPSPGSRQVATSTTTANPSPPAAVPDIGTFAVAVAGEIRLGDGTPVVTNVTADDPRWSSDAQWLAYSVVARQELHVVTPAGQADTVVWRGHLHAWSWSPVGPDRLALEPDGGGVAVVDPGGDVDWIVPAGRPVVSVAWRGADLTWTLPGGAVVVNGTSLGTPVPGADLVVASWADTGHLLAWVGGAGRLEADGLELDDVHVFGGRTLAVPLATTLVATGWVVPGPVGTPAEGSALIVAGGGAVPWTGKQVERCDLAVDSCAPVVGAAGASVTLDPRWSPDGSRVAFVSATAWAPGWAGTVTDWFPSRTLWVTGPDGPRPVAGAGSGVTAPSWTADGTWLRYSTAEAVAAVPVAGGTPVVIATGLTGGGGGIGPDGYGKRPWNGLAAWSP